MIVLFSLLMGPLQAQTLRAPDLPASVDGECLVSVPVRAGDVVPIVLSGADGLAACSFVAVPVSQLAYLLKVEKYAEGLDRLHSLDVELMEIEIKWYKERVTELSIPPKWYEKPTSQRWLGRAEMLLTVGVVASGLGLAYDVGRGSPR